MNERRKYDVTIEVPEIFESTFPNSQAIYAELTTIGLRVLFIEPDSDNDLNAEGDPLWTPD